jgi:catechol 2,3-dioxygenase-like lactoylglutathione lyase family enzyme
MVLRLGHLSLGTPDLPRAVAFYTEVLGLEVAHEFRNDKGERYGVFIHAGSGSFIELFNDDRAADDHAADHAVVGRFRHFCLEVADIHGAAERLARLGHSTPIRRGRTDGILQLFLHDPDGNMIELQEHDEQSALHRFVPPR